MTYPVLQVTDVHVQRMEFAPYYGCGQRQVNIIRTKQGRSLFKMIGECIAAGGSVSMHFDNKDGHEYATGVLDWTPEGEMNATS